MSRDAIRFGRVPKREKAKILAAMRSTEPPTNEDSCNSMQLCDLDRDNNNNTNNQRSDVNNHQHAFHQHLSNLNCNHSEPQEHQLNSEQFHNQESSNLSALRTQAQDSIMHQAHQDQNLHDEQRRSDTSERLNQLQLSDTELALLCSSVVMATGKSILLPEAAMRFGRARCKLIATQSEKRGPHATPQRILANYAEFLATSSLRS